MSCIEVKDIAQYEENDSELAKYTISKLEEENKKLNNTIETLKTEVFNGIMGFQGEGSFSLGSRRPASISDFTFSYSGRYSGLPLSDMS